jgi:hypothetical protein
VDPATVDPADVDGASTTEVPAVIELTVPAGGVGPAPADPAPRRMRMLAVAGSALVVLLATAGVAWAVRDRSGADVVLVGPTPTGMSTTARPTSAATATPAAATSASSATPTRTRPPVTSTPTQTTPPPTTTPQVTTTTAVPTTQPPPGAAATGTVYGTVIQPRRCVDVRSAQTVPGTAVQGYDCNGTGAQVVTFATAGTMQILGKCVQPSNGALTAGTVIVINDCSGGAAAQQWRVSGGAVRHLASNLCLGLPNADPANGVQLRLETCAGTAGQRWTAPL